MIEKLNKETEEKMNKSYQSVKRDFTSVRTGKAHASLLDGIRVDYHGTIMPLNQLASVSAPEPRLIVVQAWDKSIVGEISKAIQKADLGLNPLVEGNIIRLPIPALNEERRKDLVKHCKKLAEEGKIALRNIRREANDSLKKAEKRKEISEDEQQKGLDKVQELTDKYSEMIDDLMDAKESEIMEV
ncbi:MAG: ribosome recycling factor [Candidatus Zixiibacteriota bacterium]|nr:MAG: ribosome recycling factor [candidate division Zixibacteria bacterium]HDL04707.1 ribosome recycling factor [candidate division Zixibacteria bacterium]